MVKFQKWTNCKVRQQDVVIGLTICALPGKMRSSSAGHWWSHPKSKKHVSIEWTYYHARFFHYSFFATRSHPKSKKHVVIESYHPFMLTSIMLQLLLPKNSRNPNTEIHLKWVELMNLIDCRNKFMNQWTCIGYTTVLSKYTICRRSK
jgi:hypothetical protein